MSSSRSIQQPNSWAKETYVQIIFDTRDWNISRIKESNTSTRTRTPES